MIRVGSLGAYARALGGDVLPDGTIMCPGPGHRPIDRSLAVHFTGDGEFWVKSFAEDDWASCMDHVRQLCGLPAWEPGKRAPDPAANLNHREHRNARIEAASRRQREAAYVRRLWDEGQDPNGTIVEVYLKHRGLANVLPELAGWSVRFHHRIEVRQQGIVGSGMLTRYFSIGETDLYAPPSAVHRTVLKQDGSWHRGKFMLGSPIGQVVMLSRELVAGMHGTVLHVAEGIESGMGVLQRGYHPVWAATTAGALGALPVVDGVEQLVVWLDYDNAGMAGAQKVVDRWQDADRIVDVHFPPRPGVDWANEEAWEGML